jgi:predicted NUDIX family NTP pyrophosphohydrolase
VPTSSPLGRPSDLDADAVRSNTFTMEWPPRSGRVAKFPRSVGPPGSTQSPHAASWWAAQAPFVDRLLERLR